MTRKREKQNKRFAQLHGGITRTEWAKQKKMKRLQKHNFVEKYN